MCPSPLNSSSSTFPIGHSSPYIYPVMPRSQPLATSSYRHRPVSADGHNLSYTSSSFPLNTRVERFRDTEVADRYRGHRSEQVFQPAGLRHTTPHPVKIPDAHSRRFRLIGVEEFNSIPEREISSLPSFREAFSDRRFSLSSATHNIANTRVAYRPPPVNTVNACHHSDGASFSLSSDEDYSVCDSPYERERPLPQIDSFDVDEQEIRLDDWRMYGECGNLHDHPSSNHAKRIWEQYTTHRVDDRGTPYYECLWKRNEEPGAVCEYQAEKQAMKRHIEVTHLKIKPHICQYCGKTFGQKTALNVHRATHTGETPLKCRYSSCGEAFSDPARRHRHYERVHGYRPKRRQKNHKRTPLESDSMSNLSLE